MVLHLLSSASHATVQEGRKQSFPRALKSVSPEPSRCADSGTLLSKYHQLGGKRELARARSGDIHTFFQQNAVQNGEAGCLP
jgi:hypothetical protein